MNKYMLTIQHEDQKVAYIEFKANNDNEAKEQAENTFNAYKIKPVFVCEKPYESGNFTGYKPAFKNHHVSKWFKSDTACNAQGVPCGGYWSNLL